MKLLCIQVIIFILLPVAGYSQSKTITDLSLVDIIQIPWDISVKELEDIYPGGHLYEGDVKRKVVSNYILSIYLRNLQKKASLNLHESPKFNYVEKRLSKLIKSITIFCEKPEIINETLENIKMQIKDNFPEGRRIFQEGNHIGFFIPTQNDFVGIHFEWSVNNESNSINVVIQEVL